jgi:hypothetical protein
MGFLDNMARSAMYVLSVGTALSSAALIPVMQARRQAVKKLVRVAPSRSFLRRCQGAPYCINVWISDVRLALRRLCVPVQEAERESSAPRDVRKDMR